MWPTFLKTTLSAVFSDNVFSIQSKPHLNFCCIDIWMRSNLFLITISHQGSPRSRKFSRFRRLSLLSVIWVMISMVLGCRLLPSWTCFIVVACFCCVKVRPHWNEIRKNNEDFHWIVSQASNIFFGLKWLEEFWSAPFLFQHLWHILKPVAGLRGACRSHTLIGFCCRGFEKRKKGAVKIPQIRFQHLLNTFSLTIPRSPAECHLYTLSFWFLWLSLWES